jgi:uncharacterized protein
MVSRPIARGLGAGLMLFMSACSGAGGADGDLTAEERARGLIAVTIETKRGPHLFKAEHAATPEAQQRGLMFRTDLTDASAMLFHPYPATGGPPQPASFWMKNTPTPLDIIFIRPDGTIARIARAEPFDEVPVASGEPVSAVLEIVAGRAAALGIAEGDKVRF